MRLAEPGEVDEVEQELPEYVRADYREFRLLMLRIGFAVFCRKQAREAAEKVEVAS